MRRFLAFILSAVLTLSVLWLPASAAHVSGAEAIAALETLELVRGTGNGFEPERAPNRSEALVMLLRLLGRETEALAETADCPFADGGWAAAYITYAYRNGLVQGVGGDRFGSDEPVSVRDYLTMVLRTLGYSDSGEDADFSWERSIAFADSIGLTHGEYKASDRFLREDMALVSYTALTLELKGRDETLIRHLYLDGVVSGAALKKTRLAYAASSAEKQALDAAEVHELAASAVVFVEVFNTEDDLRKDKPAAHGSGFFVTADGVAVLCCHELDGRRFARVTTLDGKIYPVVAVLDYDPFWDTAVVQVDRTDTEGNTVRFFPYLEIGDSDGLYVGEKIFTVSNPLGYVDCISDGLIANRSRIVDDPDYPVLQVTAPIAQGSSGGPLLNAYGEAVGILYGMFLNGENMNLAIPSDQINTDAFCGEGISLEEMYETEDAKKKAAVLTASQTTLELEYEEEAEILITADYPGTPSIKYEIVSGKKAVSCAWGSFETKQSVPLYITGTANGEADVEVRFSGVEGNESVVELHIVVTGAPEEVPSDEAAEEEAEAPEEEQGEELPGEDNSI